ncbi:hypothetical protein [Pseudonocardia acidicola]|uniref:MYXO-CTERM domain-containing protein n=1 Tax=Pseudonocardia acidicola TaxID=2724939 RepID=A0ABX1SEG6_9PSEU|nr:hypothetical protein [Pseudonocardia acidicola]NMH99954.1 hypothetical protein [Pseudonocardia acidicola]
MQLESAFTIAVPPGVAWATRNDPRTGSGSGTPPPPLGVVWEAGIALLLVAPPIQRPRTARTS